MSEFINLNGYDVKDKTARSQTMFVDKKIVLFGDSNFGSLPDPSIQYFLKFFYNCEVDNQGKGGVKWNGVYQSISEFINNGGTGDVFILIGGGNDIPASESKDIGGIMGAPDVKDHTIDDNDTSVFMSIKKSINILRTNFPNAYIYILQRANHPNKPREVWYYQKYWEYQIAMEWGVPVIDSNIAMNFTNFNPEQIALFTSSDDQHYNEDGYNRYMHGLGAMLMSNCAYSFREKPTTYYVPYSWVEGQSINMKFYKKLVTWVAYHCMDNTSQNDAFIGGNAITRLPTGSKQWTRFEIFVSTNNYPAMNYRGLIFTGADNEETYVEEVIDANGVTTSSKLTGYKTYMIGADDVTFESDTNYAVFDVSSDFDSLDWFTASNANVASALMIWACGKSGNQALRFKIVNRNDLITAVASMPTTRIIIKGQRK